MTEDIDFEAAHVIIERIAKIAEMFAGQAGVGGMETAGSLISYLAENPRDIEPCLRFGVFEIPTDWHMHGRLSWHGKDGKVFWPAEALRARQAKAAA
ncbi:hypothetical protein [Sphingomonas oryzagri]|uniref:Uncharacterized protein n=1 Tax=Sphingomonas oryzagri TaxID=3042314 RepID=A0ABT6N7S7_9SPHN|nr:hypothetical protein [Sphingomonas oryzagri]MDH7641148.1 hypothetical protein [Sphingomonas oryzagri]